MHVLETVRLRVRRITPDDAAFMLSLLNDASFHRYIGDRGVRTVDDAVAYIAKGPLASYERFGFGLWLVSLKESGAPAGICGLLKRDTMEDVDVGFAFLPAFWSKGYAIESVSAVMAYARETLGLTRVVAIVQPDNLRSLHLLAKVGFAFERMVKLTPDAEDLMLLASDDPASLEMTADDMRTLGDDALGRIVEHVAGIGRQPVRGDVAAEALCRSLREPAPEHGVPAAAVLGPLFDEWIPRSFTTPSPGYLAFIPGGGLFPAAVADFISAATNRYTGVWMAAPALVQLEANVLEWFRDWMGFPATTRGLLTTGGSMAAFNAILCARERHLGREIRAGVLYTSTHVHHSVVKTARLAGIFEDRVRLIPVDADFRMSVDALGAAVRSDRAAGLRPFMVVSSAGTTNTGAVDPLETIADFCAAEGLWHHVDGAYGAFFHVCEHLRPSLAGLSRADSLTLDPHKGMFLPYGTGALLVRDGSALRAVHGMSAGYLPATPDPDEFYDPGQYGPELSRGFPGLRIWLCVKLFGAARFRAALAEKRALAVQAAARIGALPGVVMVAPPQLSLFAFHLTWSGATLDEENVATRALLERVTARGRVMLTGCTVDGRFLGRVCVLSFRTRQAHMDACVEDVAAEVEHLLAGRGLSETAGARPAG
jgi:aromatic-L-amino-acid decarboxylase